MIPFRKVKDSGWISLSKYLNEYFKARPEYEPQYRKIGDLIFLRGQCYISKKPEVSGSSIKLFENLPSIIVPKKQISASGVTYGDFRSYYMFFSKAERTINIFINNWEVQDNYKGIDLTLFSPYLVD